MALKMLEECLDGSYYTITLNKSSLILLKKICPQANAWKTYEEF